jgi:hypothetical protein
VAIWVVDKPFGAFKDGSTLVENVKGGFGTLSRSMRVVKFRLSLANLDTRS